MYLQAFKELLKVFQRGVPVTSELLSDCFMFLLQILVCVVSLSEELLKNMIMDKRQESTI